MTDTNQLREAFEVRMTDGGKWPAAVERGRGGAYRLAQTENAWTEWQACAESLQAIAQVQGEAATVAVDHFDNAPNTEFTSRIHPPFEIGTKLYATPQPAQATQAEVTDEFLYELWEQKYRRWIGGEQFEQIARAILSLRPERVPMTEEQISLEAHNADDRDWNDLRFRSSWHEGFLEGARFAEAHHGITAQAKKGDE